MKLSDINSSSIKLISNKELINLHYRIHQLFKKNKSLKIIHDNIIVKEMIRRNIKHNNPILERNTGGYLIMSKFISSKKSIENINEGLGTLFNKIGEFFTAGRPKDPKLRMMLNDYHYGTIKRCRKMFPPLRDTKVNVPLSKDFNHSVKYSDYQENPNYTLCIIEAQIKFSNDFIKYLKSKSSNEICKNNLNKEKCVRWIEEEIVSLESNLESAEEELKLIKRYGSAENRNVSLRFNKMMEGRELDKLIDSYINRI